MEIYLRSVQPRLAKMLYCVIALRFPLRFSMEHLLQCLNGVDAPSGKGGRNVDSKTFSSRDVLNKQLLRRC